MTRPRTLLLVVLFIASSAFAQTEHLILPTSASRIDAAATGKTTMLALFTKAAQAAPCGCGEIDALRIDFDGHAIGAPFRVAQSFSLQTQPAVAFDGRNFLAVWNELADPPLLETPKPSRVVAAFVGEDGEPSQPFVIAAANIGDRDHAIPPVVVWDGTRYFVFYSDPSMHASGVTVSAQGVVGTPFLVGNADRVSGAAASPSEVAVLSMHADRVEMTKIDASLRISTPVVLAIGAFEGRVAWSGQTFLAVWIDHAGIEGRTIDDNIYERHLVASDSSAYALRLTASGRLFVAAWDNSAVATAWISTDPFSVATSIDRMSPQFTIAPRYPFVIDVPGRGVATYYIRAVTVNQFYTLYNAYVSFLTPPRQRVTRR